MAYFDSEHTYTKEELDNFSHDDLVQITKKLQYDYFNYKMISEHEKKEDIQTIVDLKNKSAYNKKQVKIATYFSLNAWSTLSTIIGMFGLAIINCYDPLMDEKLIDIRDLFERKSEIWNLLYNVISMESHLMFFDFALIFTGGLFALYSNYKLDELYDLDPNYKEWKMMKHKIKVKNRINKFKNNLENILK